MTDSYDRGSTARRKNKRHVPTQSSHIYYSLRADGSKAWEVRHPADAEGRRQYETLQPGSTFAQAKARAHEVHAADAPRMTSTNTTFAEVVADWRETRDMRPSSEARFDGILDRHVLPRIGRKRVRDINSRAILRLLAEVPSAKLTYSTVRIVLGYAVEMGALGSVPKLPKKRVPKWGEARRRILSTDEEARLLAYAAKHGVLSQVIRVALGQALRMGEAVGLEWADVDFGKGKLSVRRSVDKDGNVGPTKGGKERVIDLTPKAREALLELRMQCDGTGRIFRNRDGGEWSQRDIGRAFNAARDAAVIQTTEDGKVTFHTLRHTSISRLANHPDIPLVYCRDFAGHASLGTTEGYVHSIESTTVTTAVGEALAA
jgi:integrase